MRFKNRQIDAKTNNPYCLPVNEEPPPVMTIFDEVKGVFSNS